MNVKKFYEKEMIKYCVWCGKKFEKNDKLHRGRGAKGRVKRGKRAKTCSSKCSKAWARFRNGRKKQNENFIFIIERQPIGTSCLVMEINKSKGKSES